MMGCDIHMFVEMENGENEKWRAVKGRNPYEDDIIYEDWFYNDRNYTLFAMLANVRNYINVKPLDEPRGVPDGCSKQYIKCVEEWGSDGHSHSYLTLEELLDYFSNPIFEPYYTQKISKTIKCFYPHILELKKIADENKKEYSNIRIVFFFDC